MTLPPALRPVVAITQARISSSRLPAKVLIEIAGHPLLWWHLSRLKQAHLIDRIVVATTQEPEAAAIVAIAEELGIAAYRGSLDDVLARFSGAAQMARAATVIRVTSDCPLIDPALIDLAIESYAATWPGSSYVSIDSTRYPRGLDCEVFARTALDAASAEAVSPFDHEHVTPFIRANPARFNPRALVPHALAPDEVPAPQRWCVDTVEDLALVRQVLEHFGDAPFGWRDILSLIDSHPEWYRLNAHVAQKA